MLGNVEQSLFSGIYERWICFKNPQISIDTKVKQQAQGALQALGLSYALTDQAGVYFGAVPCSVALCQGLVIAGTLLVTLQVANYVIGRFQGRSPKGLNSAWLTWAQRAAYLNIVNGIGCSGLNTLLHEGGHALAGLACFRAHPTIVVYPFRGGETRFTPLRELTQFGSLLGTKYAKLAVILAGIGASVAVALIDSFVAHSYKKSCPQLATALHLHAISQLANEVLYGLTSLLDPVSHAKGDFMLALKIAGVSPVLLLFLIVAIPLAQQCLLNKK